MDPEKRKGKKKAKKKDAKSVGLEKAAKERAKNYARGEGGKFVKKPKAKTKVQKTKITDFYPAIPPKPKKAKATPPAIPPKPKKAKSAEARTKTPTHVRRSRLAEKKHVARVSSVRNFRK
jgi:hypothetical protein